MPDQENTPTPTTPLDEWTQFMADQEIRVDPGLPGAEQMIITTTDAGVTRVETGNQVHQMLNQDPGRVEFLQQQVVTDAARMQEQLRQLVEQRRAAPERWPTAHAPGYPAQLFNRDRALNPLERFQQFLRVASAEARRYGLLNDLHLTEPQFLRLVQAALVHHVEMWRPEAAVPGWFRQAERDALGEVPMPEEEIPGPTPTAPPPGPPDNRLGTMMDAIRAREPGHTITLPPLTAEQRAAVVVDFAQPPPPPQ